MRRAAIIGCGRIAGKDDHPSNPNITTHARAIAEHPGFVLDACVDPDPAAARAFAAKWAVPRMHSDVETLLREARPEVCVVAAPTAAHGPILRALLAHPDPLVILCEKPIVETPDEWRRLAPALRNPRHAMAVNYPRRFDRAHRELKEFLRAGSLGGLMAFHATVAKGMVHNGSHMVDLIQYLLGDVAGLEPVSLRAAGDDLEGTALFRLASGVEGTLTGVGHPGYSLFELDLIFARGKVEIRKIGHRITAFTGIPSKAHPGFFDLEAAREFEPSYHEAFLAVYDGLASPGFRGAGHWEHALAGMDLLMGLKEKGAGGATA